MNTISMFVDHQGIATITLNKPSTHNAFDEEMIAELNAAMKQLDKEDDVKVLLIKSNGRHFSAGADINWMKQVATYSQDKNIKEAAFLGEFFYKIYHFKKPTVAMVQGNTYGGGIGILACCQMVIASSDAKFCFSEVKLGLIPSLITPYIINAIGVRQARAYFLSAKLFDAATALNLGLVHEVAPINELENRTQDWINALLKNGPIAMNTVHNLLKPLESIPISPLVVTLTAEKIAQIRVSEEGQEGLSAFLEKRPPNWI